MWPPARSPANSGTLTPEQYRRAQELAAQAFLCPHPLRKVFLGGACGADTQVFEQATALLEARETLESDAEALEMGSSIGPYRVECELGRGGMGVVYLASRPGDGDGSRFALKVIREDLDDETIIKRFALERRVLATLHHPNIARMIDAGKTDDGQAYIVMEYVDGLRITDYADRSLCTLRERLVLFRAVCDAVEHAHARHIVHRDIKPSNILVTADGVPKLLDFGIAKLSAPGFDMTQLTAANCVPGTPLYASPEQLLGQSIDARTDVYALGVVLFELLTGWWPFVPRKVLGGSPTRPSEIISDQDKSPSILKDEYSWSPAAIARARRTTPRRLVKELRGDLDAIVLNALREDPSERYETAAELSRDLLRYLDGSPVSANPLTPWLRVERLVQRHPRWMAATVSFGLIVLTSWLTWPLLRPEASDDGELTRRVQPPAMQGSESTAPTPAPQPSELASRSPSVANTEVPPSPAAPRVDTARPVLPVSAHPVSIADASANDQPTLASGVSEPTAGTLQPAGFVPPTESLLPPSPPASVLETPPLSRADPGPGTPPSPAGEPTAGADPEAVASVRAAIDQFIQAMESGSAASLKQIYPGLTGDELLALDRTFALGAFRVAIDQVFVRVTGDQAVAVGRLTQVYTPIDGLPRSTARSTTFSLTHKGDRWLFSRIDPFR